MPIYEFVCKDCRNEFKTLKRSNQLDSVSCPTCGTARWRACSPLRPAPPATIRRIQWPTWAAVCDRVAAA